MESTAIYTLNIPTSDRSLLRSLAKKMGWTLNKYVSPIKNKRGRIDKALEAAHNEPLFETNNIDELMADLLK